MSRRRGVQVVLGLSAAAGLVGAHVIAYLIALPDAAVRSAILRTTGHGYLSAAVVVGVVAGIFGVLASAALGFRAGHGEERVIVRWRYAALRIAVVQTTAFLVLEGAERAAANIPPIALSPRIVAVGVAVQATLACLAALVIAVIARAAKIVAAAWLTNPVLAGGGARARVPLSRALVPRPAFAGSLHARAPPASSR